MTDPERRFDDAVERRLEAYLAEAGLAAVWFARSANFAWVTGGDNVVDRAAEPGCAAVGYDGDGLTVLTSDIEGARLGAEELPPEATVETYPWHDGTLTEAVAERSPRPAAADVPVDGLASVDASALRQPLTDAAVERYRALGATVADATETVCRRLSSSTSERTAAARLRGRLAEAGVDAPVVLVGGARRAQSYRHYTPTDSPVGDYALVSVTARRGGLYASCTRTVAFDPPAWLRDRHGAAAAVEVAALAATRRVGEADGTADAVFDAIREAYRAVGHDDEWREHHQGGATGYAGREWFATPDSDATVALPGAYAWNPTVSGAKSEGTVHVTADEFEPLTLSTDGDWPTTAVSDPTGNGTTAVPRPDVLSR